MYYDNYYQDEGEREKDEEEEESMRGEIIEEAREVYSGAYMDDGNSQRTLSQWKAVSRH
jgi:hypothetical protein